VALPLQGHEKQVLALQARQHGLCGAGVRGAGEQRLAKRRAEAIEHRCGEEEALRSRV
jgi:hypothetical protein